MRYLGIFGLGFYRTTVIFEIGSFEFVLLQNLVKKQKWLHLGSKMPFFWVFFTKNALFEYFWARILKTIVRFEINLSNCKILWNNENAYKFGTKSALFGYFWARILKQYRHVRNQHLPISVIAKFCEETKMPISWNKNALFGYF